MTRRPVKIVSGGQTGVDRGALDAAIAMGVEHGGWCPRARLAEDGRVPDRYDLQETESSSYAIRTEQNVVDSDATWHTIGTTFQPAIGGPVPGQPGTENRLIRLRKTDTMNG